HQSRAVLIAQSLPSAAPHTPPKEKCGSSNTICKQKQSKRVSKKRKKQGQKNQTSEPEVSHSQHVKSISSKTKRTKGQKVKTTKRGQTSTKQKYQGRDRAPST
ncbi:MAG: hypothetical protein ACI35U_09020, partial [Marinilabiliaceae bacterium]